VISLLNAYFIPVYTSMEDYGTSGTVPDDEKKAYQKIYHAAHAKKLSTGTVHIYILTPDGDPIDSIHVAHANTEKVTATLKGTIEKLGTKEGKPLVEIKPQAASPRAGDSGLVLYLIARSVPGKVAGFWQELPGEDFITYTRDEWKKFLPAAGTAVGASYDVDRDVALKLLNYFYPSTENNDVSKNEVEQASIRATLVADGRLRLDATLRMKHPFYHRKDEARVEAVAVGVIEFDAAIRKFRMATEKATYNGGTFGVAVKEVR
jgi:hypothetical protein